MLALVLLVELVILYLLSQHVSQMLYGLFLLLFRSRSVAISATTLLFFPGTVIHELAHLFTAEVLGVHTGKLSLVPENLEEEIQAGSVQIAKSDPFRRYAIGLAPMMVGLVAIGALSYWLPDLIDAIFIRPRLASQGEALRNYAALSVLLYLLFVISNSMFSSKEDLKGFVGFAIAIGILIAAGYSAGIRIGLTGKVLELALRTLDGLVKSTALVLAVNGILLLTIRVLIELIGKITHHRITN